MPGQFSAAIMFFSVVAIALAANRAGEGTLAQKSDRSPASIATLQKEQILEQSILPAAGLSHTEKLRGPLSVALTLIGDKPHNVGDVFTLRGHVHSRKPLDGADFTWTIPDGVELVSGPVTGHVDFSSIDDPAVELVLRKVRVENAQVHLMAVATNGAIRFGDSAQYNTDLQDAIDAKKEQMRAATETGKELKIFH